MKFIFLPFKYLWRLITWVRTFFFNVLFLIILIGIFSSISAQKQAETKTRTGALHLMPSGYLVDQVNNNTSPLDLLAEERSLPLETSSLELIQAIKYAAIDDKITGIALQLDYLYGGGLSKLEEVGAALEEFKKSNKPIVAFSGNFTQQQYYLASYANTIYINDLGNVFITGYGSYRNYLKDATDKLGIRFHIFRVGEYKDAIEPYLRNDMSDASKEHNEQWLTALWGRYTNRVETLRGLRTGAVKNFVLDMPNALHTQRISSAQYALKRGLVDQIVSQTELNNKLIEQFGLNKASDTYLAVDYDSYMKKIDSETTSTPSTIGLIAVSGAILDGFQNDNAIGSASFNELLEIAQNDAELDALVVRVDSPGGSAFASEVIRQKIIETRNKGLPVYVSMGSVAASGGYWIASAAEEIWATPSTITGSIGVYGVVPNFTDALKKIGISSDGIGTTPLSDAFRPDRHMSEEAKSIFQSGVNNIYSRFLTIVSESRNKTPEQIDKLAQGRVWAGEKALNIGLVDKLGNLEDVFESIANTKELGDYSVKTIRRPLTKSEQFIQALMEDVSIRAQTLASSTLTAEKKLGLALLRHIEDDTNLKALSQQVNQPGGLQVFAQCLGCIAP